MSYFPATQIFLCISVVHNMIYNTCVIMKFCICAAINIVNWRHINCKKIM